MKTWRWLALAGVGAFILLRKKAPAAIPVTLVDPPAEPKLALRGRR